MIPNIHIIGIQGSGKGVQSSLLVEEFSLNYIASGNIFRQRAKIDDALGKKIMEEMSAGQLLSTSQLVSTVKFYLENNQIKIGILGDGVIRTVDQNIALEPVWSEHNLEYPLLFNLILNPEEAIKRIEKRKNEQQNPNLHEYHKIYGGKLAHRQDDNPTAIHERIKIFQERTKPVIDYYKSINRCYDFDASNTIEEIHNKIKNTLLTIYPEIKRRNGTD